VASSSAVVIPLQSTSPCSAHDLLAILIVTPLPLAVPNLPEWGERRADETQVAQPRPRSKVLRRALKWIGKVATLTLAAVLAAFIYKALRRVKPGCL
jgi:hypothetical protein